MAKSDKKDHERDNRNQRSNQQDFKESLDRGGDHKMSAQEAGHLGGTRQKKNADKD